MSTPFPECHPAVWRPSDAAVQALAALLLGVARQEARPHGEPAQSPPPAKKTQKASQTS